MKLYALTHLADQTLIRELKELVTQDRATTAALLAHIAEVDERKLYLPAASPSMYMYCVRELGMSEDTAFRRIHVARTARRFPTVFSALADGQLNLTSVLLLTPYLRPGNAEELLGTAAHKSKAEIEILLAERFPRPDVPTMFRAISPAVAVGELAVRPVDRFASPLAPEQVEQLATQLATRPVDELATQLVPEPVDEFATSLAPEQVDKAIEPSATVQIEPPAPRAKITPISPGKFAMQLTIDRETQAQLRYAQALLGHAVPAGDVAQVLKRALDALVQQLEQKKFAKCTRSRSSRSSTDTRYVPAEIRRSVWHRDGGQCTFVSSSGRRCEERTRLEFDHAEPFSRGGQTTAGGLKLKCRAHNQYAAECTFGAEFMRDKREQAQCRSAQINAHATATAKHDDIIPWLRQLGFSVDEARRGAAQCASLQDAPLDQRVRVALQSLAPNCVRRPVHVSRNTA